MITVNRVERYGVKTNEQPAADAVRRELCLCLHCSKLGNCPIAESLFLICQSDGLAVAVTRCAEFERRDGC